MKKRRSFSREFKLEAVKKVVLQSMSPGEVARDLDIRDNLLHNWKRVTHQPTGSGIRKNSETTQFGTYTAEFLQIQLQFAARRQTAEMLRKRKKLALSGIVPSFWLLRTLR